MIVDYLPNDMITNLVKRNIHWTPTMELWIGSDNLHNINWSSIASSNLGRFVKMGGKVALGTNFGGYVTPFDLGMPITELKLMQKAGMSNMEIIVAATKNAAWACGMENEIGTIETGKFADLLLAYNNPLKDLKALLDVKMVIRNGEHIVENHEARARRKKIRFCPPDPTIITE